MTVPEALAGFGLVALLLTILPGLDTALVLRTALTKGRGHAYAAAAGIAAGCFVWGAAAAVGATALLAASRTGYRILTLAGAVYLVWLGIGLLRAALRPRPAAEAAAGEPGGGVWRSFGTGALTNLLNPKVGVFYLATIPQFVPDGVSPLAMGVALGAEHNLIGLAWFTLLVTATGFTRRWLSGRTALRVVDGVTGTVLVGFGAKVALEAR